VSLKWVESGAISWQRQPDLVLTQRGEHDVIELHTAGSDKAIDLDEESFSSTGCGPGIRFVMGWPDTRSQELGSELVRERMAGRCR
jgi:hypothetical protein